MEFTALPFVGGSGPDPAGSGFDPLLDRALDIGEGFLNRVQDRKDAELAARLEARSLDAQQALLARLSLANQQGGTITPAAASGGSAASAISPGLLLLGGAGLLAIVLLRK